MKLQLPKEKLLEKNVFFQDNFYTFNESLTLIIHAKLEQSICSKPIGVDANTIRVLQSCTNPLITIDEENNLFIIKDGKKKYKAKILSNTNPHDLKIDEMQELDINLSKLKIARKFVAKNETRPILTSVKVDTSGAILATDSYSLYLNKGNKECENVSSYNIPSQFIDLLSESVSYLFKGNESMISAQHENITFFSRLIAGQFPNVSYFTNEHNFLTLPIININKNELRENFLFAKNVGETGKSHPCIALSNGSLECVGENHFSSELSCVCSQDFFLKFSFNTINLILDVTNNVDVISLYFKSSTSPTALFKENEIYVFSPIR